MNYTLSDEINRLFKFLDDKDKTIKEKLKEKILKYQKECPIEI